MIGRIALASLEKVADSLLGALVGKAVDVAVQQFCEQRGVEDDRKQLQDSLDHARLILGTIENVRIKDEQIEQQGYEAGNRASSSSNAVPSPSKRTETSISSYISGLSGKGDDDDDDVQRMRQIKRKLDNISVAFEKICSLADAEDDRGSIQLLSLASQHMGGDVDAIHLEEPMAKKMMCMLKGSPLAAKILGGLLSMKLDVQHWKSILDSELWQLPQEENGIMSELQLSYQYLPPHLKQCFEFCSLFPKNYRFSESELIGLWMAEGFIEPQESIRMEELASNYFHELVNRSFFQKSKDRDFIMHNLIHDLAELSSVECLPHGMKKLISLRKFDGASKFIPEITEVEKLASLQNLRTFKVPKDSGHKLIELNGLKQLRGGLHITNLENVENTVEASLASLKSKEHLNRLELEWTPSQESDTGVSLHISEKVLEELQPYLNLCSMTIRGYNGAGAPNWLQEQSHQLFGRDKDLQELKDLLLKPEVTSEFGQSGESVLSITGIGGIGKTTLAQKIFHDSSVEDYFKLRIWVSVSKNFCIDMLIRKIIEYATKEKCVLMNFTALQEALKEKIMPERFLLVLDDVWNEDRHKWGSLCAPLRSGKPGSKILVTTRSRQIANMVGDVDANHLKGLDQESFWEFFKKCAFGSSNSGVHHPHLEAIAKKMIWNLKGSPVAAKTLGGLLSMKLEEQYWKNILDSEIWQLPEEKMGLCQRYNWAFNIYLLILSDALHFVPYFLKTIDFQNLS
ncbi:hypothetical protein ZIOFF_004617 [Zingiber officinale]|uniref:Uncharacterized protein n=1 Tax=Zingiber officinale TaxID=94328 RepID=A0A8J5I0R7_ZINOF|nr:hypothetical protein ZIOFF_004617 [Zingiber officinale]